VRRGQRAFRNRLVAKHGPVCAISGPAPLAALEAGHLYSYADVGHHDEYGGLLLRRDVHRLFDLGQIAIHPDTLRTDVQGSLLAYPQYAGLQGQPLAIGMSDRHRRWLRAHGAEHRSSS
jgi:hypothetical protein